MSARSMLQAYCTGAPFAARRDGSARTSSPIPSEWLQSDFVSEHLNYHLFEMGKGRPDLRAHYAWGVPSAAQLAKVLGHPTHFGH